MHYITAVASELATQIISLPSNDPLNWNYEANWKNGREFFNSQTLDNIYRWSPTSKNARAP